MLIDPPWSYYGDPNKDQAAGKHYDLVDDEDLHGLPVLSLLSKKSVVFLWCTSSTMRRAMDCLEQWGLHYRGVGFVWVKTRRDGTVIGAQGVRPSITKPTTELVLCGSMIPKGRPLPLSDESIAQVVLAPRGEHSEKPSEVQSRIEKMYPGMSKIELFARRKRTGWTCWGNEV